MAKEKSSTPKGGKVPMTGGAGGGLGRLQKSKNAAKTK